MFWSTYLHQNGCLRDIMTTYLAAENGYLDCLTYALKNGCQYDEKTYIVAARKRHLNSMKYIYLPKSCSLGYLVICLS